MYFKISSNPLFDPKIVLSLGIARGYQMIKDRYFESFTNPNTLNGQALVRIHVTADWLKYGKKPFTKCTFNVVQLTFRKLF